MYNGLVERVRLLVPDDKTQRHLRLLRRELLIRLPGLQEHSPVTNLRDMMKLAKFERHVDGVTHPAQALQGAVLLSGKGLSYCVGRGIEVPQANARNVRDRRSDLLEYQALQNGISSEWIMERERESARARENRQHRCVCDSLVLIDCYSVRVLPEHNLQSRSLR